MISITRLKKTLKWLIPAIVVAAVVAGFLIYTRIYYHADPSVLGLHENAEQSE